MTVNGRGRLNNKNSIRSQPPVQFFRPVRRLFSISLT